MGLLNLTCLILFNVDNIISPVKCMNEITVVLQLSTVVSNAMVSLIMGVRVEGLETSTYNS